MATETVTYIIMPAIIMGGILGLIEMFFVHSDEIGMGWFMHGLHALPFTMLFTFIAMNTKWALQFIPGLPDTFWVHIGVQAAIAVVGMIKVAGAAAIAGRVGERFHHTLIIGGLIFASPWIWMILKPVLGPLLPF
jgi:hypothetical protein